MLFIIITFFNRCTSRSERKSITAPELKTENENRENLDRKSRSKILIENLHFTICSGSIVEKQNNFLNYLNYSILLKAISKYKYLHNTTYNSVCFV